MARTGNIKRHRKDVESTVPTDVEAYASATAQQGLRQHLFLIESDKAQLFESLRKELEEKTAFL